MRLHERSACWCLLALLVAVGARAEPLEVTVVLGSGEPAGGLVARVQVVVGDRELPRQPVEVPGRVVFEVPAGAAARVEVAAEGFWSPAEVVFEAGPTAVRHTLHPLGTVVGTLRLPPGEAMPEEIQVRAAPAPGSGSELPESEWRCPVVDGAFRCPVPAGILDLRLRARSFVSHHLWGRQVPPGGMADVGALRLEPGASIVGWVAAPDAETTFDRVEIEATPLAAGHAPTSVDRQRVGSLVRRARANERGFFAITGIAPGSYAVTVRHPAYAPARVAPVQVLERSETEIHRIELSPPVVLEVLVDPPRDPFRNPWRVEVLERADVPGHLDEVAQGVASEQGVWRSEALPAGSYAVGVRDSRGSRWAIETVFLEPGGLPLRLELPFDRLEGTLTLGGEPLAAALFFGGEHGAHRIRIGSDAEGRFYVFLPRQEEPWVVDVVAPDEGVSRRVEDVAVRRLPGEPWAKVEIDLPATRISGVTVDAAGEPVPGAVVEARRRDHRDASVRSAAPDGEFELRALEPGRWLVQARSASGGRSSSSESMPVTVGAEEEAGDLRIVLREDTALSGLVVSPTGQGVAGARVLARTDSSSHRLDNRMPAASTDVDGLFELRLPHGTERLILSVLAPGFAVETVPLDVRSDAPLVVPLQQAGGTVVVTYSGGEDVPPVVRRHRTELFHPEQVASSWQLRSWAEGHGVRQDDPARFVVPMLEPGPYTACYGLGEAVHATGWLPAGDLSDRCASGTLAPFGELHLTVPVPEPPAGEP